MAFTGKTFVVLVLMVGLVAAEQCGLTVDTDKEYDCNEFVEAMTNADTYDIEGFTLDQLKELNPELNCDAKIKQGVEVCVGGHSMFDDETVQQGTTLNAFQKAMGKLKTKRSNKFDQDLFDLIGDVISELTSRKKRGADGSMGDKEKQLVNQLSEESKIDAIKAAIAVDPNFKTLEAEFNRGRKAACEQLKRKEDVEQNRVEEGRPKGKYRMCVCARKDPPPFIHCQALLMKEKIDQNVQTPAQPDSAEIAAIPRSRRFARGTAGKSMREGFQSFMTKRGCPTIECLTEMCFPMGEYCVIIPKFPILSLCVSGEGCVPNPANLLATGGALQVKHFEDSKIGAKIGICVTGFHSVLSWLGLESCLAALQLEYYYFKSQLDASIYLGYVVIKVTGGVKAQIAPSFSTGIGGAGIMVNGKKEADLCKHDDYKCQNYCVMEEGELLAYIKVEYWWWGWREAFNQESKPNKAC